MRSYRIRTYITVFQYKENLREKKIIQLNVRSEMDEGGGRASVERGLELDGLHVAGEGVLLERLVRLGEAPAGHLRRAALASQGGAREGRVPD